MGLGRLTGAEQAQNAARRANAATQATIQQGRGEVGKFSPQISNLIGQGTQQNLGYLDQARGQYQPTMDAFRQALQQQQGLAAPGGVAGGIASIINDPNNAMMFDAVNRQTQNDLSGLSARRSGYGLEQSDKGVLDAAFQQLGMQQQANSPLLSGGFNAQNNIANLFQQSGNVANQGSQNLANAKQNELNSILNLIGQSGQSESAKYMGMGNAATAGMGSLLSLGGQLGGAYLGKA